MLPVQMNKVAREKAMPNIEVQLGSVNIPDNAVDSGKLTQQDMKDWLDEQFDTENAGGDYIARITTALRAIGIRGVTGRVSHMKLSKARKAVGGVQGDLTTEDE
jgi:hypothetical protein